MSDRILKIVNKNRDGELSGIYSVCSANPFVLRASIKFAKRNNTDLLIEATSNQVDQYGGYTGMKPIDFRNYVKKLSDEINFPFNKIILGGDHLGPNVWQNEPQDSAMIQAREQIKKYVEAGFTKIHLDASMRLGGESVKENGLLDAEIVAERSAILCQTAEETANSVGTKPVYVIGTDVPVPGGAKETEADIRITKPEELSETIEVTKKAFYSAGLHEAWDRVAAVVVQPGVEFSDSQVFDYNRMKSEALIKRLSNYDSIAFEAHSTDYQTAEKLREMSEDNFAILKVGPWLTFAMREALFALSFIEDELLTSENKSNVREVIETEMRSNPKYWEKHYHGDSSYLKIARSFSYSDRIRYYWINKNIEIAMQKLFDNLQKVEIPVTLISQFLPKQYDLHRKGKLEINPVTLIENKIEEVLRIYSYAVGDVDEK
jgi:D-tagatose-1,6-bisphosphate aldolase subunit GatZ/KbaZ